MAISANKLELLQIAGTPSRARNPSTRQIVLESMEDAMQKAARSRYGQETEVRAEINPKTGEVRFSRLLLVVEEIDNDATQIPAARRPQEEPGGAGSATGSRRPCRRSTSAASPRNRPSRSSCRRSATPSATASKTSTRTASATSSTAS